MITGTEPCKEGWVITDKSMPPPFFFLPYNCKNRLHGVKLFLKISQIKDGNTLLHLRIYNHIN